MTSDGALVCKSVIKEQWTKAQSKVRWLAHHVGLSDASSSLEGDGAASPDGESLPDSIYFKTIKSSLGF